MCILKLLFSSKHILVEAAQRYPQTGYATVDLSLYHIFGLMTAAFPEKMFEFLI